MKLLRVLSEGPLQYDPEFSSAVDKIKDAGGTYIDSGDYGSVFLLTVLLSAVNVTTKFGVLQIFPLSRSNSMSSNAG